MGVSSVSGSSAGYDSGGASAIQSQITALKSQIARLQKSESQEAATGGEANEKKGVPDSDTSQINALKAKLQTLTAKLAKAQVSQQDTSVGNATVSSPASGGDSVSQPQNSLGTQYA